MVLNKTKKNKYGNKYRNIKKKYNDINKKQTKYTRLLKRKQKGGLENPGQNFLDFSTQEAEDLKQNYMNELQRQKEMSFNRLQNSVQEFKGGYNS
jgi:hypothetical protein